MMISPLKYYLREISIERHLRVSARALGRRQTAQKRARLSAKKTRDRLIPMHKCAKGRLIYENLVPRDNVAGTRDLA